MSFTLKSPKAKMTDFCKPYFPIHNNQQVKRVKPFYIVEICKLKSPSVLFGVKRHISI